MAASGQKVDLITSFSAGEFTPALAGHVDMDAYKNGSRFVENFLPEVQGGLKKFYGTKQIGSLGEADRLVMVPFDGHDVPIVLVIHDGAVSVVDDEEFYDLDLTINIGDYYDLMWQQNNDVIYFAQKNTTPFAIKFHGRDEDTGKCIFEYEEMKFVDVPYFPLGWSGNYNGVVKTNGSSGTIEVTLQAETEGRLYLPSFLRNMSGDKNVISPDTSNAAVLKEYMSDAGIQVRCSFSIGTTTISVLRIRNDVTTVLSSTNIGSQKTTSQTGLVQTGVPPNVFWHKGTNTAVYKTINMTAVLNAVRSYLPTATLASTKDYIAFTEVVPDHQAGDQYAIRISQGASSHNGDQNKKVNGYRSKKSWPSWTQVGDSYEPIVPSSTVWDDENLVGRKIKFLLEPTNTVYGWRSGESITAVNTIRYSSGSYYKAMNTGTCGSRQPIHHDGVQDDGGVAWAYLHSGYGTATVISVESATQLTAVVDGALPVLTLGESYYSWTNYQWSIWGFHQVYPSHVFFFKNRLGYFCPTDGYGCWFSASSSDDYYNFATESYGQVLDTCGINILMSGHSDNNVNWVMSGDRLYCGSYAGEYNILGSGVAISPTDCVIDPITNVGGAPVRPIRLYGLNLFVGRDNNEIYSISYDYTTDDYSPENIGLISSHLLMERVSRWEALPNTDRNIYFVTKLKTLRTINYIKELKNLGYFRINVGAEVEDVAASSSGSRSILYITTKRGEEYYVEKVMSEDPNYMLFAKRIDLSEVGATIDVSEFVNKDVWVKNTNTGQFYKTTIVEADQIPDLRSEWQQIEVGLPMECALHGQAMSGEKLEGLQQKSVRFIVRLRESGTFSYGSSIDFSKKYEYNNWNLPNQESWDSAHKLITGDIQLPASFGYTVGMNKGTGEYPNDTGVGLNIYSESPEPFCLLSVSCLYV